MRKLRSSLFILIVIFSFHLKADLDDKIFISGKIGNAFNKERIKVIDSHNQVFYLPRAVFPKDFKPKQDENFNVEISVQQFKELEIKKVSSKTDL